MEEYYEHYGHEQGAGNKEVLKILLISCLIFQWDLV